MEVSKLMAEYASAYLCFAILFIWGLNWFTKPAKKRKIFGDMF